METYLEALDLWEAVEEYYEVPALPNNPTMAQIKAHKEKKTKAKACLFAAVSSSIFTRIMSLKSAKEIWDYLKVEYEGDERIKGMQVLNLIREFELQRMKDSETIKEYSDRLLSIANKVRLLESEFTDSRIVEKVLVAVPDHYLGEYQGSVKNLLAGLLNALQEQEQRRLMRADKKGSMETIRKPIHLANIVERRVILHSNAGEGLMHSVPYAIRRDMKLLSAKKKISSKVK
ncbi:hypothetical protein F511_14592 [Dorcoceras hygrometricum]|uniref:Uncharacterized protein n=1 Tax=Dorcoceras hygrometricum TaxID=472368 RepID=A0A2Z7CKB4_9LAMI|nr:hypothetical protein F511_14592 [Dorcoceras hygrometricum]